MSNLPRILSLGPRPVGNDPLSLILAQLWDVELEVLVLPRLQQAQQSDQAVEAQKPSYTARTLSPRGLVE